MAIFISMDKIQGDVSAKGYEHWISADSLHFHISHPVNPTIAGEVRNRVASNGEFHEMTIMKKIDAASSDLFQRACQGASIEKVIIKCLKTGKDELLDYLEYQLSKVIISSIEKHIVEEGAYEKLLLSYTRIVERITPYNESGEASNPKSIGYNIESAETL